MRELPQRFQKAGTRRDVAQERLGHDRRQFVAVRVKDDLPRGFDVVVYGATSTYSPRLSGMPRESATARSDTSSGCAWR